VQTLLNLAVLAFQGRASRLGWGGGLVDAFLFLIFAGRALRSHSITLAGQSHASLTMDANTFPLRLLQFSQAALTILRFGGGCDFEARTGTGGPVPDRGRISRYASLEGTPAI
jgi:hypothetical protein